MDLSATQYQAFVTVTPGLETLLLEEIEGLELARRVRRKRGGVELLTDRVGLWRLVHLSRLAESVRVRVGRFRAHSFERLEKGMARLPWTAYVARGGQPAVRVTCRRSALYHSGAVRQRVVELVRDRLAVPKRATSAPPSTPTVYVRLARDVATVSIDASGDPLHRRGHRTHIVKAPLRETLAAACIRAANLPDGVPLWDPFCGSGSLVIEALAMDRGGRVARPRPYAFECWPTHDGEAYGRFLAENLPRPGPPKRLGFGSDLDPHAVAAAQHNAEAAGLADVVRWMIGDFAAVADRIPQGAAMVTNPPYGHRTAGATLQASYKRLGELLRRRKDLDPVVVLSGHRRFRRSTGLTWHELLRFSNRGLPVELSRLER